MTPRLEVHGVPAREAAGLRAAALDALDRVRPPVSSARVALSDDNGPKGGPAMRCTLTVSVPHRGPIHVEARATSARLALAAALGKLDRRLGRTAALARASRRRPKKYFTRQGQLALRPPPAR
jgi:hypothetical protein